MPHIISHIQKLNHVYCNFYRGSFLGKVGHYQHFLKLLIPKKRLTGFNTSKYGVTSSRFILHWNKLSLLGIVGQIRWVYGKPMMVKWTHVKQCFAKWTTVPFCLNDNPHHFHLCIGYFYKKLYNIEIKLEVIVYFNRFIL